VDLRGIQRHEASFIVLRIVNKHAAVEACVGELLRRFDFPLSHTALAGKDPVTARCQTAREAKNRNESVVPHRVAESEVSVMDHLDFMHGKLVNPGSKHAILKNER